MAETPAVLEILDLSEKHLKKLAKPTPEESLACALILDDNELQRLEGIDSYTRVQKLSAVRNQLLRMYSVCRLHNLHTLNLAHNGILTIEGLKDLVLLKYLNLAGNSIKTIEHLNTNTNLEHLDLSENSITHITDLSYLKNLKELQLHNNKISHLRQCERFLPSSLTTLTLANNAIPDLNEIGQLAHLVNLNSISIVNNPCVVMTGQKIGFDYRPFVINWCLTVQVIDGYVVDAIESLRGEWLYSQGRGRHFRIGDHQELAQYLASVCPLSGEQQLETEEDRKLRLILSKAQHHQQQLREQGNSPVPSPSVRKKFQGAKSSPRLHSARLNNTRSPDKMTISCYNSSNLSGVDSGIMSQSLDPSILSQQTIGDAPTKSQNSTISMNPGRENGICLDDYEVVNSPLQALSKLVPVPESLMSPDYRPSALSSRLNSMSTIPTPTVSQKPTPRFPQQPVTKSPKMARSNIAKPKANINVETKRTSSPSPVRSRRGIPVNSKISGSPPLQPKPLVSALKKSPSTDDESEICDSKLHTIQMKAEEKRLQKDAEVSSNSSGGNEEKAEMAAIFIQKMWRGFYTRQRDKQIQDKFKTLQARRADEYLQKLACDMESTKAALESERKIQMLQMQAINALWKKVSALQPEDGAASNAQQTTSNTTLDTTLTNGALATNPDTTDIVHTLTATCTSLQNQVQQLQGSMQDMVKFMSLFAHMPVAPPMNNSNAQRENGIATQTEIVAVHTPQGDSAKVFPFQKQLRPSSLPLPVGTRTPKRDANTSTAPTTGTAAEKTSSSTSSSTMEAEVRQFAGTLVDGVIKTVSEGQEDCLGVQQSTEITVTDTAASATYIPS